MIFVFFVSSINALLTAATVACTVHTLRCTRRTEAALQQIHELRRQP